MELVQTVGTQERKTFVVRGSNIRTNCNEDLRIEAGRMKGNSTRQVDLAIQILFKNKKVCIVDHVYEGNNKEVNKWLLEKVVRRLHSEHPNISIEIDKPNCIISLIK